jgi:hypothetical protein
MGHLICLPVNAQIDECATGGYPRVAEGLAVAAQRVTRPSEIVPALRRALTVVEPGADSGTGPGRPALEKRALFTVSDIKADAGGKVGHTSPPRHFEGVARASLREAAETGLILGTSKFLAVGDDGLLIDQHALHERILFEQLLGRFRAGPLQSQRLLLPETVALPAPQGELAALGLAVEDFGGGTVLLAGYPAALGRKPHKEILQAVADHLAGRERAPDREQLLHELLALMACHTAVRAGDRLTLGEIGALLAQRHLAQVMRTWSCRPSRKHSSTRGLAAISRVLAEPCKLAR